MRRATRERQCPLTPRPACTSKKSRRRRRSSHRLRPPSRPSSASRSAHRSDDPNDPDGLAPRLVTSWTQFESLFGGFVDGAILPLSVFGFFQNGGTLAYIVRIPNSTPAGEPARLALPAADRALGTPAGDHERRARRRRLRRDRDGRRGPGHRGPVRLHPERRRRRRDGGAVSPTSTFGGPRDAATVINKTSTQVKVELKLETDVDLASQLELLKPGHVLPGEGRPGAGAGVRPQVRRLGDRAQRDQRSGDRRGRHDGDRPRPRSPRRPRTTAASIWACGRPCRPRSSRTASCTRTGWRSSTRRPGWARSRSRSGAARSRCTTRPSPRCTTRGSRSRTRSGSTATREVFDPAVRPHRRRVGPHRRHPRGVEGAGQRHDPWRARRRAVDHPERAVAAQPDRDQLHPPVRHARHPDLGRPDPRVATPTGSTSTCAGCSTWSSRRSWTARSGRSSSRTTSRCGRASPARSPATCAGCGSPARCSARPPTRRSSSGATQTTNPPESIDAGKLVVEVGMAPVKPAEFVIFRISQNKQSAS